MLNDFVSHKSIEKIENFYIVFKRLILCGVFMFAATPAAYASTALYSLVSNQDLVQAGLRFGYVNNQVGNVYFDDSTFANLSTTGSIDVPIPGGKIATGKVVELSAKTSPSAVAASLSATKTILVSLEDNAGSVEIVSVNNTVTKMMLHDVASEKIYTANINANGNGSLIQQDNNDYYCVRFPETDLFATIAQQDPQLAALMPDIATLQTLQSRPESANVLYLDFWGGSLVDTYWNVNYTSNAPIDYSAYDVDLDPNSFSNAERYSIWLAWRESLEDFAPFDINITTSRAVYDAALVTNRAHMIITDTKSWYPNNAGGVALVNIFDDDTEYSKVAWTWNLTDSSMGMTISHEAGHQLSLSHDGLSTQTYYQGHGVWGPIMGAPFGKPYVQWSKGEYPDANQNEDDIAIVSSKLGLISDDAENDYINATNLDLPVSDRKGLLSYQDVDAYKFTLTSAGVVDIKVIPLLGNEDEIRAANLSMDVNLVSIDANGSVISNVSMIRSSDDSPLSPLTNKFEFNDELAAGSYVLEIIPTSPDTNFTTGFNNYGNAGEYLLSINARNDTTIKTLGRPALDRSTDVGLFIWENARNRWMINVLSADQPRTVNVNVLSRQPLSDVVPVSLETSDVFTEIPNGVNLEMNVQAPWMDGVKFTVQDKFSTCVSTSNIDVPIYVGPDRIAMPNGFDLNNLEACQSPTIRTIGKPDLDRATDVGIFVWESTNNNWVMNVLSGDQQRTIDIDVQSQQPLSNILPLSIEVSDIFTQVPNGLDLTLMVTPPWMDGVKFTVQDQSSTCLSTTNTDMPIYLGPERINVSGNFNLNTLSSCQ